MKDFFDLLIIGGGINGASIARDASLRGLNVCIVEKNKLASGASSNSSKLAHGGLRYLEQFEFSMVKKTLKERDILLKTAPKYVKPLEFIYPVYKFSKRPFWKIKIGLKIYSLLSKKSILPTHKILTPSSIIKKCPQIKDSFLVGGASYYDGQLNDKEMVLANIKEAKDNNTEIHEHTKVINFIKENGKVTGINILKKNKEYKLFSKCIINTTGAWTNTIAALDNKNHSTLVTPTKGVHIVLPNIGLKQALILETPQDNRIFFLIPWNKKTLVGTTDTPFSDHPDNLKATQEDLRYLLKATNYYLKNHVFTYTDIIDTFVGLRPLQASTKNSSKKSRDFSIFQSESGLIHLFGGKYTSYRLMAEIAVDKIIAHINPLTPYKKCITKKIILS